MRICYFGIYKSDYSRNKILIAGLRQNNVEVIECRTDKKGISKYFDLIKKHYAIRKEYDVMVVGYPGFQCVILAKFLTRKKIIFDAFISIYDSMVLDRRQVALGSLRALYFWWLDKVSMAVADLVLFDTEEHIKYVCREFGLPKNKFKRIFVGADTEIFYPRKFDRGDGKFKVLFYGTYIPLQGIEYIIKTAKLLEKESDIFFEIIGDGQESKNIRSLAESLDLKNVIFTGKMPIDKLAESVSTGDVCLGIFGNTEKAQRVIPNKVYECVAMKKAVITGDTPAINEFFGETDIFRVGVSNPEALRDLILSIKTNRDKGELVANNGYNRLIKNASSVSLGVNLKMLIEDLKIS